MRTAGDDFAKRDRARIWRLDMLGGVTLTDVRYSGQAFRPHRHDVFTIGAIFEGLFGLRVESEYRRLPPGRLSFLAPHEVHAGECLSAELRYRTVSVGRADLERLAGLRPEGDDRLCFENPTPWEPALLADFVAAHEALEGAAREGGRGSDLELVLAEMVRRYGTIVPRRRSEPGASERSAGVRAALELIEASYECKLELSELAARARLSVYHFVRSFQRETGLTPHSYLIWFRVERAKELLLAGRPPADVAVAVGFYDQSHLGRHFRSVVGATPGEFVRPPDPAP